MRPEIVKTPEAYKLSPEAKMAIEAGVLQAVGATLQNVTQTMDLVTTQMCRQYVDMVTEMQVLRSKITASRGDGSVCEPEEEPT